MGRFFILSVLLLCATHVFSQDAHTTILQAEKAIEAQHYEEVIDLLRDVVKNTENLSETEKLKAHYYLADALILESQRQMSIQGENVERKYANYYFEASELLVELQGMSNEGTPFQRMLSEQTDQLFHSMLMSAVQLINSMSRIEAEEQPPYLREMMKVSNTLIALKPDNYLGYDYRGQTQLMMNDSGAAYEDLIKGISLYDGSMPDAMAPYMHYRTALLELSHFSDPEAALDFIRQGLKILQQERERLRQDSLADTEKRQRVLFKYEATEKDLTLLQLEALASLSSFSEQQREQFRKVVGRTSLNTSTVLALAERLHTSWPKEAHRLYESVLESEPDNVQALFNAGVLFYNRAAKLSSDLTDRQESMPEEEARVLAYFNSAIPYFEKAYALGEVEAKGILLAIGRMTGNSTLIRKYR